MTDKERARWEAERRREKARALRYKKPIAKDMNLDSMRSSAYDMQSELEDVTYVMDNDDIFRSVMDGDEDEAFQYRCAFESLSADIERFLEDIDEDYIPECFDTFMAAVAQGREQLLGFDSEEGDYFGLGSGYMEELALDEARKKLSRMTKEQILEAAQQCFGIAVAFLGIRTRFGDLKSALDVIRGGNAGLLKDIDRINELYDHEEEGSGWREDARMKEFARLIDRLPAECWLR